LYNISKSAKNPGIANGLKPVVGGKPGECKETVDKIIRIKSSLVDVVAYWSNKSVYRK
jgi:hypothetical protein